MQNKRLDQVNQSGEIYQVTWPLSNQLQACKGTSRKTRIWLARYPILIPLSHWCNNFISFSYWEKAIDIVDRMINNAKFIIITEFLCIAYKSQCHMIRSRNNALADGLHKTQKKKRERAVYRNLKTWDTYLDVLVEVKPRLICLKYIEGTGHRHMTGQMNINGTRACIYSNACRMWVNYLGSGNCPGKDTPQANLHPLKSMKSRFW